MSSDSLLQSKLRRFSVLHLLLLSLFFLALVHVVNKCMPFNDIAIDSSHPMVIFTATRYQDADEIRFQQCLHMISQCQKYNIPLVIVDSSPPAVTQAIQQHAQRAGHVQVHRLMKPGGKKGSGLREGADWASRLPRVSPQTFLCWQEPEKVDMVRQWYRIFQQQPRRRSADVLLPYRDERLFQETYPIEEFHSETYGNLHLDAVAKQYTTKLPSKLDWYFGPFAVKVQHAHIWTSLQSDSWDAVIVPLVYAVRQGLTVESVRVQYRAPLLMKQQEEHNMEFMEKRLAQLNDIDTRVKLAWTEDMDTTTG